MSELLSDTSERTEHSVTQEKTKAQRKHQRNKANKQAKRLAEEKEAEVLEQAKHQVEAEAETASRQQESEELEEVQKAKKKRHHRGKKRRKSKHNTESNPDEESDPDADSEADAMAEPVADLTPEEREKAKKKAKRDRRWENQKVREAEAGIDRADATTDEPAVIMNNTARKAAMKARREQGDQHAGDAAGTEMASAEPADTEKPISTPGALAPPHLQSMSSPTTPIKGTRNITPLSPLVQQGAQLEDYVASSDSAEARYARLKKLYDTNSEAWYNEGAAAQQRSDALEKEVAALKKDRTRLETELREATDARAADLQRIDQLSAEAKEHEAFSNRAVTTSQARDRVAAELKQSIKDLSSELFDVKAAAEKQGKELDGANALKDSLHKELDDANEHLRVMDALRDENSALIEERDDFNARLEDMFEFIGRGLSPAERLTRLQELKDSRMRWSDSTHEMHSLTPGSRRSISGATLEDDLAGADGNDSETDVEDLESPASLKTASPDTATHVPEPQVVIKEVHVPEIRYVHVQITSKAALAALSPWLWLAAMLLSLFIAVWAAALAREKAVWRAANSLTYDRLLGQSAETWAEWVVLGVERMIGVDRSVYG